MKLKFRCGKSEIFLLVLIVVLSTFVTSAAQVDPEKHAQHHPGQTNGLDEATPGRGMGAMLGEGNSGENMQQMGAQKINETAPGKGGSMMGGGGGGMGGGKMGGMMQQMGAPKEKDLYPSLMSLPNLPLEKRAKLQKKAHGRMKSGVALMDQGFEDLSKSAATDNFTSMQEATTRLREGLSQFESGLATHRALKEGKAPNNIALQWFKREMGLLPNQYGMNDRAPGGLSPFHFFVMTILSLLAITMIGMYFFKMRRATDLLQRLVKEEGPVSKTKLSTSSPSSSPNLSPQSSLNTGLKKKWSGELRVARIFTETPEVKTFRMVNVNGGSIPFTFEPGQYLNLSAQSAGKKMRRCYTIVSSPTRQHYCEITVKRVKNGLVSQYLHDNIKEGDLLEISAAAGSFVFTGREKDSIVLIGGGVGITPLMSVIRYLTDTGWKKDIYFLYSCRTLEDFIFKNEIEYLKTRNPNIHITTAMERIQTETPCIKIGRLTKELISESVPEISSRRIHLCGPPPMMDSIKSILYELGVSKTNLKTEIFGSGNFKKIPGTTKEKANAQIAKVTFKKSGKSGNLSPENTILEVAEELGVELESSCRSGVCGTCKVRLLSGSVTMECEDGLEPDEKEQGVILACQAMSRNNVEVDA